MSFVANTKLLTDIANRCGITDQAVLRKGIELMGLLGTKKITNCPETCKAVVCLELACNLVSSLTRMNRADAVKYSGCTKSGYSNAYNNISKLLNLDKVYSIREVCLSIGTSEVQIPAEQLFDKYKTIQPVGTDLEHPMYCSAAVAAICRKKTVKVNMKKLLEISRIKKRELESLIGEFVKLEEKQSMEPKKSAKKRNCCIELKETPTTEVKRSRRTKIVKEDADEEEYKEWKRRMLEE